MYDVIDRAALKAKARRLMKTASVSPIKVSALYYAILLVLGLTLGSVGTAIGTDSFMSVFCSIVLLLMEIVLSAGTICYCMGVWRGEKMPYASLFDGFAFAGKVIALELVMLLFIYLWSMLFIIPGIVAMFRYSFAMNNLCMNPELGVMEALELSKKQTSGFKMQLLTLYLSFFGWALLASLPQAIGESLSIISGGTGISVIAAVLSFVTIVAQVFLLPYMQLSYAGFYLQATMPLVSDTDLPPAPPEI